MAFIGLRYPVIAKLAAHTPGSEPTYEAGMFMGKARRADLNIERSNNPLRGDDEDCENDNSITGMTYTVEADDVSESAKVYMGLLEEVTSGGSTFYREHDGPSEKIGHGYMRVRQLRNQISYQCIWIYSIQMAQDSDSATTKPTGGVEWQTPTLTGRATPLKVTSGGRRYFRKIANFQDEDVGLAWLKDLAGIV